MKADAPLSRGRTRRVLLVAAGWASVGLGLVGAALPLVPTTPFLILAAACFVRSSPRLYAKLLAHPRLGPYLEQWRRDRSVPPGAKRRAYLLVVITFSISIAVVAAAWLRLLLVGIGIALLVFLSRLRTAAPSADPPPEPPPEPPGDPC